MKKLAIALLLTTSLGVTACSGPSGEKPQTPAASEIETRAQNILSKMTLEEKIGQILQADISAVTPEEAKQYHLGSVLNGGNSAPGGGKIAAPEDWIALADAFWDASTDTADGGVGVPLLWGTDAVHGHNNLQSATIFPHNSALGAANDAALIEEIGAITAREIRATGTDWTFAPTLAVAQDDRWGRAYESYSERPEIVAKYSKAMVEGLQASPSSDSFLKGQKVIATAKHFLGDGGTQFGIDKGDTIGDEAALLKLHGAGYGPAIDAGVQTVMSSFSSINGEKMHGSKRMLTDVLRGEMGFDGFVVGDWNGHGEIPGCTVTDCPEALIAGIDMYMAPDSWRGLYDSLLAQAKSGEVPMDRLDEAVTRILEVKIRSGLFDAGRPSTRASADLTMLGADDHTAVARRAVRQSLVLLKNSNGLLPVKGDANVLVTGSGADSMQQQTGGWTLNWQGDNNPNSIFESGETVFSGIQTAMKEQGGQAVLSADGSFTEKPDLAIVVFGEQPYAEFFGDRNDLVFESSDGENLKLLKTYKSQGIPVVSVFLTGRPMWVNPHLNASDGFVVGWLPGTEAGGIADVIVGDSKGKARHNFSGKLSFSWPSDGTGTPINKDTDDGILFPYGYGLSYADAGEWTMLSEDSGVDVSGSAFEGKIVTRGAAAAPFALWFGDSSNSNTPVTGLVSSSLGGIVKTRGVDYKAQEDSREITWTGNGTFSVRSGQPLDISADTAGKSLSLTWRIDEAPSGDFTIGLGCSGFCTSQVNTASLMAGLPSGEWGSTEIPLSCFVEAGLQAETISAPLILSSTGDARISLHETTLRPLSENPPSCPAN